MINCYALNVYEYENCLLSDDRDNPLCIQYLLNLIDELRKELYTLTEERGLKDEKVIDTSQQIDELLNIYYKSMESKKQYQEFYSPQKYVSYCATNK